MGREIRRVPAGWQHPKDGKGHHIPMHEKFPYDEADVREGLRDGWLEGRPPHYGVPVMPDWPAEERTHYQMYETCTEGTPISPVMASPEKLARWLARNKASAFGGMTASYDEWLATIRAGYAVSAAFVPGKGLVSGVELEGGGRRKPERAKRSKRKRAAKKKKKEAA